jgi:hypothetical protein
MRQPLPAAHPQVCRPRTLYILPVDARTEQGQNRRPTLGREKSILWYLQWLFSLAMHLILAFSAYLPFVQDVKTAMDAEFCPYWLAKAPNAPKVIELYQRMAVISVLVNYGIRVPKHIEEYVGHISIDACFHVVIH